MKISVVTTMYQSECYLEEFYSRTISEVTKITEDYEIIFVNDGSPDLSLKVAITLFEKDPRVKVIDLSRNFGHHKAMMTGLSHSQGQYVFLIDCDLEEPPELLGQFMQKMHDTKADVVYGVQAIRKGRLFERFSGEIFFRLFNLISDYPIPHNLVTLRLMTKRYVKNLVMHLDRELCMSGIWAITGFDQVPVIINKRDKRTTSYTWSRKAQVFINAVTSFSSKPLVLIFYLGMIISFIATVAVFYLIICRILFEEYLTGWPSLVVSVWLLGGITICCLGILGIYLARIFSETKRRPYTVIRNVYDRRKDIEIEL